MPSPFPGMDPYLEGSLGMTAHGQLRDGDGLLGERSAHSPIENTGRRQLFDHAVEALGHLGQTLCLLVRQRNGNRSHECPSGSFSTMVPVSRSPVGFWNSSTFAAPPAPPPAGQSA